MVNVKFTLGQVTKAQSGSRDVPLLFFTLGAIWGMWSTLHSYCFTSGKDPVPTVQDAFRPQERSGRVQKISPAQRFDPPTV